MSTKKDSSEQKKTKSKFSRRSMIIGAVLLTVLAFGVYELGRYTQKWGEPNELRAIKSESLAKTDLLGLELVEAEQSGQGDLVSKAVSPSVTRTFKAENGNLEETRKKIIKFAESEGWAYSRTIDVNDALWYKKQKGRFELTLIIKPSLRHDNSVEVGIF